MGEPRVLGWNSFPAHHVISPRSEKLSSCLASPGLGTALACLPYPVSRCQGDGHLQHLDWVHTPAGHCICSGYLCGV